MKLSPVSKHWLSEGDSLLMHRKGRIFVVSSFLLVWKIELSTSSAGILSIIFKLQANSR